MAGEIHVGALEPEAFVAIQELAYEQHWPVVHHWMAPADVLLLLERLKRAKDTAKAFPLGKNDTIARLRAVFEGGFIG